MLGWDGWLKFVTPQRVALLVPIVLGGVIAYRYESVNTGLGETGKAAIALLFRGELADPYIIPTGPTAHVSPVVAGLIALIYALMGPGTDGARFLLGIAATAAYAASALVAIWLLEEFKVSLRLRWLAAILLAFVPFMLFGAVVNYRQWDQPLAALLLLLGWLICVRAKNGSDPLACGSVLGALAGMGGLVSPTLLPPLLLSFALLARLAWRGRVGATWWCGVAVGMIAIVAFLLPWGLRNYDTLGYFTVTRSNFGLELALGNLPVSALTDEAHVSNQSNSFDLIDAGNIIHPFQSVKAAQEVARIGEVAYMRAMRDKALIWIADNPSKFGVRCLDRLGQWFFPARDSVGFFPVLGDIAPWIFLNGLGLLTVMAIFVSGLRQRIMNYAALFVILPMAPYLVTHMNPRYAYVVYFTSVVLIIASADALIRRWCGANLGIATDVERTFHRARQDPAVGGGKPCHSFRGVPITL